MREREGGDRWGCDRWHGYGRVCVTPLKDATPPLPEDPLPLLLLLLLLPPLLLLLPLLR